MPPAPTDKARLPNWALATSYATQAWLLRLSGSVLGDPRLWLVLRDFEGLPQTDENLAAITYFVLERRGTVRQGPTRS